VGLPSISWFHFLVLLSSNFCIIDQNCGASYVARSHVRFLSVSRQLLRAALPLLQSRNNGVVTAVASLYFYLAPRAEMPKVGKAMARLLKNPREVRLVVICVLWFVVIVSTCASTLGSSC
jgi:hypothetical protein